MTINCAFFISYPHSEGEQQNDQISEEQRDQITEFIGQLRKALEYYLPSYIRNIQKKVVIDKDYLKPGHDTDKALAKAICESVCMIVVFVPSYLDSIYCKREFLLMEKIERERKQVLGRKYDRTRRMIIPIILRGDPRELPQKIKDITYSVDFSQSQIIGSNMWKLKGYQPILEEIVRYVHSHYKDLRDSEAKGRLKDCSSFRLPSKGMTIRGWSRTTSKKVMPFPGKAS